MLPWLAAAFGGPRAILPNISPAENLSNTVTDASNDIPIVSIRLTTAGKIDKAEGDDSAPLSYSTLGNWLNDITGIDNSLWEGQCDIDVEDAGDPGSFSGTSTGSFFALSSERTWIWSKDALDAGIAGATVTLTVRSIADTSNTVSKQITMDSEIAV